MGIRCGLDSLHGAVSWLPVGFERRSPPQLRPSPTALQLVALLRVSSGDGESQPAPLWARRTGLESIGL